MNPRRSEPAPSYRERIHDRYITVGPEAVSVSMEAIQTRRPIFRQLIKDFFPKSLDAEIVDLGCGGGGLLYVARELGYRKITGVDVSPKQVAIARKLGIEGVDHNDCFQTLCILEPRSQDAIVTYDVIEHLRKEELEELMDEIFRVLRDGGRWIIHAPNAASPFFGRIRYGDFSHQQGFTEGSIKQLALSCGFQQVLFAEDAPIPHGIKSLVRLALWKILRGFLRTWLLIESGTSPPDSVFTQNLIAVAVK